MKAVQVQTCENIVLKSLNKHQIPSKRDKMKILNNIQLIIVMIDGLFTFDFFLSSQFIVFAMSIHILRAQESEKGSKDGGWLHIHKI